MIIPKPLTPKQSLKKSFLKQRPRTKDFEEFKKALSGFLHSVIESESEEHNKNNISKFLSSGFYKDNYINTKQKNDLVIYLGKDAKSKAGVLIEVKHPGNKHEMISKNNLNGKAMYEVILYYLRERIEEINELLLPLNDYVVIYGS